MNAEDAYEIDQFVLPRDYARFCTGCLNCFTSGMASCPHASEVALIWEALCGADLIVWAQPTYAGLLPAQGKALLDHLACRWMVHCPEPRMFHKRVVILSQAIGMGMRKAGKNVKTSFRYLGTADIGCLSYTVRQSKLDTLALRGLAKVEAAILKQARRIAALPAPGRPSLMARRMVRMMRIGHSQINRAELKAGRPATYDYLYWKEQGWMDSGRPWDAA